MTTVTLEVSPMGTGTNGEAEIEAGLLTSPAERLPCSGGSNITYSSRKISFSALPSKKTVKSDR